MNGREGGERRGWPDTYSKNRKCNEGGRWKEAKDEGGMRGVEREKRWKKEQEK